MEEIGSEVTPFGCPNTLTIIIRNKLFSHPLQTAKSLSVGTRGSVNLFWNDRISPGVKQGEQNNKINPLTHLSCIPHY
jgi:hypothetical protein